MYSYGSLLTYVLFALLLTGAFAYGGAKPALADSGLICEAECSPWVNIFKACTFGNPNATDELTQAACLCEDPDHFQNTLENCSACIQALDISDPQMIQLRELIEKYADAHICEMIKAELPSAATPRPTTSPIAPDLSSDADTQSPVIKPSDRSRGENFGGCCLFIVVCGIGTIILAFVGGWIYSRFLIKHKMGYMAGKKAGYTPLCENVGDDV